MSIKRYFYYLLFFFGILLTGIYETWANDGHNQIGMLTGSATGTYIRFGREIAEQAQKSRVDIMVKESKGSIENIERMMSRENAAFAIVQSDVLGVLKRSASAKSRSIARQLRLIYPFYNEEVHLFARKSIQRFSDLEGSRVVLGTKGSGNWLTSENLLKITSVTPAERLYLPPKDAVKAVLLGKADAMFYVSGKPTKQFLNLNGVFKQFPQLVDTAHFVPLEDARMLKEYVTSDIGPEDYAWTVEKIPTIAVKAVLVTYDFTAKDTPYYRMRCNQICQIAQSIRNNLNLLRMNGHPKWKEVNLDEHLGLWQRDTCSRCAVMSEKTATMTSESELANELEKALQKGW